MYFDAQASITRAHTQQRRIRQQVVGVVERDKALRMLSSQKDLRGILDADHSVTRCVHDQERLAERAYSICQAVLLGVRDETAPNAELAPREHHLRLTLVADFLQ